MMEVRKELDTVAAFGAGLIRVDRDKSDTHQIIIKFGMSLAFGLIPETVSGTTSETLES
jgi:hypothetical protein